MTRYLCPKCEDHPILTDLMCDFCGGEYIWKDRDALSGEGAK